MRCQKFHKLLVCQSLRSLTFDRMGNYEIGLLWAGSSKFPSSGTGITSAIFHALGKAAILNELFTSLEITGAILSQLSFRTRAEILSYPGALLVAKLLMTDLTSVFYILELKPFFFNVQASVNAFLTRTTFFI